MGLFPDYFDMNSMLSSPYAAIGVPLGLGLLSGATPGTARVAQGLVGGVGLVQNAQRQRDIEERRRRLQGVLPEMLSTSTPQTVTKPGVDPQTASYETLENDPRLFSMPYAEPEMPTYQATEQKPVFSPELKAIALALSESDPMAAVNLMGRNLPKGPDPLHPLQEENLRSQIAQRNRPDKPQYVDLGGQVGEMRPGEEPRLFDKTPRPEAPPTPADIEKRELERRNIESQIKNREATTRVTQQRETRLRNAEQAARDPAASEEKLTTMYNALLRDRQNEFDETKLEEINTILDAIRSRIARLVSGGNAPASSIPQSPTAGSDPKDPLGIRRRPTSEY